MNKIILTAMLVIISFCNYAQIKGVVTDHNGSPLVGATIYWEGTTNGCTTDEEGNFTLEKITINNTLVISFIGYTSQKITAPKNGLLKINLSPDTEFINEVAVVERDPGSSLSRIDPIQTTKISGAELCKAACCNIAESFTTNPSVDVTYSDAVTGAKQIRLLGLSGLYVQTMAENMPAFRGLASIYGLEYIPGAWMESIQVSKGMASVINGYEAIAGQINIEYKKPERSEKLFLNGFINSDLRTEYNINASTQLNGKLSTMVLGHFKNGSKAIDDNGDNFLDAPMVQQYNFINRWNYKSGNYVAQYGARIINETRQSGQRDFYKNDITSYGINIETERYELFTKQALIFNEKTGHSIAVQLSGSHHKQNSLYGKKVYDAAHSNAYLNVIYQNLVKDNPKNSISFGASIMYDNYDEKLDALLLGREEIVPGVFAQYTYNNNDRFVVLAGLRTDYHNEYGVFVTPRLHTKYNISEKLHLRGSIGLGYRSANIIAENSYLLASSRLIEIQDKLDQEKAMNTGFNIRYYLPAFGKELVLSADYYYSTFFNQIIPDTDSDPHKVSFYNLDGKSYSHSAQTQATYEIVKGLNLTGAFRVTDVKMTIGDELKTKPLVNLYKGLLTTSYQTPLKKWQVDFTAQFNGGGRMPTPNNDLWESEFEPYTILNAQVTKYYRNWSFYVGGENLTNFKIANPIIDATNPWGNDFDASLTWGPVHGMVIYGGFRFAIDRDN